MSSHELSLRLKSAISRLASFGISPGPTPQQRAIRNISAAKSAARDLLAPRVPSTYLAAGGGRLVGPMIATSRFVVTMLWDSAACPRDPHPYNLPPGIVRPQRSRTRNEQGEPCPS